MRKATSVLLSTLAITLFSLTAQAAERDVSRLEKDLTPVGAERAGNASGTIPEWTGGLSKPPQNWKPGTIEVDPFPYDERLFTIHSGNASLYKEHLTPGQQAMMNTYPDSYYIPVYKTRRTAAYPDWIYEKLKENAKTATLIKNGNGVRNTIATSPFPMPENGLEALWNHILRYRGKQVAFRSAFATPQRDGSFNPIMTEYKYYFAYSEPGVQLSEIDNKIFYLKTRIISPASLSGTRNLVHETLDQIRSPRLAWRYQTGERRLRRSPNLAYQTNLPNSEGFRTVDQKDMYNGAPNQYDWTLKGKREIYVPYNSYGLHSKEVSSQDIVRPGHINQALTRYELHRVWVVEAKLRVGMPHIYHRRVFYLDEDSWQILLTEEYAEDGHLWRVSEAHPIVYYGQPLLWTTLENTYDLDAKRYFVDGLDTQDSGYIFDPGFTRRSFTASAVRREARR
ncbi:DUF1329 domain-containing protein [Marinobacteraceae bacterium S3BR75-40.1]